MKSHSKIFRIIYCKDYFFGSTPSRFHPNLNKFKNQTIFDLNNNSESPENLLTSRNLDDYFSNGSFSRNHINETERVFVFCKKSLENYLSFLTILQKQKNISNYFSIQFHENIIFSHFKTTLELNPINITQIYTFVNSNFKNTKLESFVSSEILKMEDKFESITNNEHYLYTFCSKFPNKFSKLLETEKLDIENFDLIDSLVMKLKNNLNQNSARIFLENLIKNGYFDQINDCFFYNDHIDTFLRLTNECDTKSIFESHKIDFEFINAEIKNTAQKILEFGSPREIKQMLPKFIQFFDFYNNLDPTFPRTIFDKINPKTIAANENNVLISYGVLLNYMHLASKLKIPFTVLGLETLLVDLHKKMELSQNMKENISDKDVLLLLKVLHLYNRDFIEHNFQKNVFLIFNDNFIEFIDFKLRKFIYLKKLKMKMALKIFMFLRANFLGAKSRKLNLYILNIKRLEFMFVNLLVNWNFNENESHYLKILLTFCNQNNMGANSFKELIKLALENANLDERMAMSNKYQKVKEAKMGLEKKQEKWVKN